LNIKELEQKYNDFEKRLSKVESCLRDTSRRHGRVTQLIRESLKESSQGIETHIPRGDLGG
jgi:hypothetical protein